MQYFLANNTNANDNSGRIMAIILLLCGGIALVSFILRKIVIMIQTSVVRKTSKRYQVVLQIISKYQFIDLPNSYTEYFSLKSKRQFDSFDAQSNMMQRVYSNRGFYSQYIYQLRSNYQIYCTLCNELQTTLVPITEPPRFISKDRYAMLEEKLCQKAMVTPVLNSVISAKVSYTSPQRRNFYNKQYRFTDLEIEYMIKKLKQKEEFKQTSSYQRSLLTNSMRYNVFKRDNFRCVICGRSPVDGITLHADHIKPIAKGGKTEMNNLRTLCSTCNSGKSDKWDARGPN